MNVQELATAVEEQLPVKVLLLDNASLGMVRQQQDLFWGGRRTAVDLGAIPDWELLARAFGWSVRSIGDGDERRGRARRDARRARPRPAARPHRPRSQLPPDVPPRRRRAGDDRLGIPAQRASDHGARHSHVARSRTRCVQPRSPTRWA